MGQSDYHPPFPIVFFCIDDFCLCTQNLTERKIIDNYFISIHYLDLFQMQARREFKFLSMSIKFNKNGTPNRTDRLRLTRLKNYFNLSPPLKIVFSPETPTNKI
jgi:hypothetical protein